MHLDDNVSVESGSIVTSQNSWEFIGCFAVLVLVSGQPMVLLWDLLELDVVSCNYTKYLICVALKLAC